MIRELKLQVWHKQEQKMYIPNYLHFLPEGRLFGVLVKEGELLSIDDFELRECTGLKDCKGQEIYEGDIVRINHPHDMTGDFTNAIGEVFWWNEEGGWYHGNGNGRPPKRMWKYAEVIGNIYENSELLQKQD